MNEILLAITIVAAMGLLIGLILAVASIIMAVPKDEKAEAVLELLPGANCGACGFSGCSGYAKALAHGEAEVGLCPVGGAKCAADVAKELGAEVGEIVQKTAMVNCNGNFENTGNKMEYQGIKTCSAAAAIHGGPGRCSFGCIGFGDCVAVCEYDSIKVENGVAKVDYSKCKACSKCVKACPKNLISLVPVKKQAVVRCSNCDKGAVTRNVCKVGCIGCMKCTKVCPVGAVTVTKFNATVDSSKCTGCGLCADNCPQGCITIFEI